MKGHELKQKASLLGLRNMKRSLGLQEWLQFRERTSLKGKSHIGSNTKICT